MTDKELLECYRFVALEAGALARQRSRLRAISLESEEYEELFSANRQRMEELSARFEDLLLKVDHPRMRYILRSYYGLGQTDDRIGHVLGLHGRTICKLRNRWVDAHSKH